HLTDVRLAGDQRQEAVEPEREPAVRRRTHRERLEQEPELRVRVLVGEAHRAEDALLHLHVVDTDRAGAELPAVPDQVVVLSAHAATSRSDRNLAIGERPAPLGSTTR